MEHAPLLFSLLFFAAFAIYLFFGIHIIYLNPRAPLNIIFTAVCAALGLWALGFSLANSAPNLETCLFWRRVSALGWSTVYGLILHFLLLLGNNQPKAKRWKPYLLLYTPALITLYIFAISDRLTALQYNLVKTDYGWINMAINNGWDWFFYIYYIGYVSACLVVIWRWKQTAPNVKIQRQASLIFIAFLVALCLGTLTDVILSSNSASSLPQMAPIFPILQVVAIHYSIKQSSLMGKMGPSQSVAILTDATRLTVYRYLASVFLAGGMLGLFSLFLPGIMVNPDNPGHTLYVSGILLALGLLILILQLIKEDSVRVFLIMAITLFCIPVITLRFVEYSSITIWVFPTIIMMATLVFNTLFPLILVTAVAVITQLLVWIHAPAGPILMDQTDYIIRIGILLIALWVGIMVNRVYMKRLKENIDQGNFQKIVTQITFDFVSINQNNIDQKIRGLLKTIGQSFQARRAYICLTDERDKTISCEYEWCQEGVKPGFQDIQKVPLNSCINLIEQLVSSEVVHIEDMRKFPDGILGKGDPLNRRNTAAVMLAPIEEYGDLLGYIGLELETPSAKGPDHRVDLLKTLANLVADGLIRVRAEKEVEHMAFYDQLTGLPNRSLFSDRLTQAIHLAERMGRFVLVMLIDLDSFKAVNDTLGHSGGDAILKEVAQALVRTLRKTDTVARFGGDEFLIMVNNLEDKNDISTVADNIMGIFKEPFTVDGQEFFITGSAGIAVYPFDGNDSEALLKNADIAMYIAKSKGKNQHTLCTEEMKDEVMINRRLSNELYRILDWGELQVHYQPQINLISGNIVGVEALLRWKHPELGMIPPSVFIPLAEMNGTINNIGHWVLKTATIQNKKWQDMGLPPLRMGVNLSVVQLYHSDFIDGVASILKESGLKPEYLELEITEGVATQEADALVGILQELKNLGVFISIDDFGTEYSSLGRLKILPIDRIKIDMQFVQGIEYSEKDQAIARVIINLAKNLGIGVLAEGVETVPQMEFLAKETCDDVQGFYFYKPMPAEEIEALLLAGTAVF